MMRRLLIVGALLGLPALVLAGWLFSSILPTFTAPAPWWLTSNEPGGAPAACEAAGVLRLFNAERVRADLPVTAAEARKRAERAINRLLPQAQIRAEGGPTLVRLRPADRPRAYAWIYTARIFDSPAANLPGAALPGPAAVLLIDAESGAVVFSALAAGAGQGEASCPFPWRDWAVETVRSVPFLALAGYSAALIALTLIWLLLRWAAGGRRS